MFSDLLKNSRENFLQEEGDWVIGTSLKIIEDVLDANFLKIKNYAGYLNYAENPKGEELDMIKKYYQMTSEAFNIDKLRYEDEFKTWEAFGLGKTLLEKTRKKIGEISQDQSIMGRAEKMYDNMMGAYKTTYTKLS